MYIVRFVCVRRQRFAWHVVRSLRSAACGLLFGVLPSDYRFLVWSDCYLISEMEHGVMFTVTA